MDFCLCSKRILNTNNVSYLVPLHGQPRPACNHQCYESWVERDALNHDLRRRENATRIIGSWGEGFQVAG